MELLIEPMGVSIDVKPGANLLEVLRERSVPISYSCMAGRCGVCRCRLIDGHVMLSSNDLRQPIIGEGNDILACQSTLTGPCRIEIPEPDEIVVHPARILKASVVSITRETHDIMAIRLKSAKQLEFSPGQYATLQFTPEHVRPYSMAGIAGDELLEFHVRLVPGGRVSSYVFDTLKLGDAVRVSGPLGASYLRTQHTGPILCVGGGTGLAPVLSILRGALAAGMANPIHLYFGVRTAQDVYRAEALRDLAAAHPQLRVNIVIANGDVPDGMRGGLVTDVIEQDFESLEGFRAYLCGPPPMVEATTLVAKRRGLPARHIYADAFYATGS